MNWAVLAGKEFIDSIRSRRFWVVMVVFSLVFVAPPIVRFIFGIVPPGIYSEGNLAFQYVLLMSTWIVLSVPAIGILLGYASIAGDREHGQLKLLMALPFKRWEVVAGKFLGRTGVGVIALIIAHILAYLSLVIAPIPTNTTMFLALTILTISLFVVYVGIGIGISAAVETRLKAALLGIGLYVITLPEVWGKLFEGITLFFFEQIPLSGKQEFSYYFFFILFNPSRSYQRLLNPVQNLQTFIETAYPLNNYGEVPFWLETNFAAIILLLWLVLPLLIGYVVFRQTDLT